MTEHRDSLVGRAVEAAARERFKEFIRRHDIDLSWDEGTSDEQEGWRIQVRPAVLVALGVVADHCTTEADAPTRAGDRDGIWMEIGAIEALRGLAAELRETPE